MVRQLVELHGGRVEVESRPGEGATFHVWLPSAPNGVADPFQHHPSASDDSGETERFDTTVSPVGRAMVHSEVRSEGE